ncbi:motility associated factor glycosyltransferase family protein [Viridibacillus arvi]|uniref:motility associated factor glycosyltransferase family protein n=1 Tax=Viridibacillus arvi TaxID=263475 RepID=UPI003D03A0A9
MIQVDNRTILKKCNPLTFTKIVQCEEKKPFITVEPSKKGKDTLSILKNEKLHYLHSKYDPEREAITFINQFANLNEHDHIFFIGTGLGYHIEQILINYPHVKYSIYEPDIEILKVFLSSQNLEKMKPERLVQIFTEVNDVNNIEQFMDQFSGKTITLAWPVTKQLYSDEIENMNNKLIELLKEKRSSLGTNAAFQQRWIINSIINFPTVLSTPNILIDIDRKSFEGKPVLLVAAGPSLSFDIELIRKIKDEGRAYVFAVGSAINALIAKEIIPDAFFSYDPSLLNQKVAEKVKEQKLNIPLVFGSSIGFETLNNYPAPTIHFITSQDSVAKNLLSVDSNVIVYDAPSIAILSLQILLKLKFSHIILAGQNLGYLNSKKYASEIKYDHVHNELNSEEIEQQQFTQSVEGEEIATNYSLLQMKSGLEAFIKQNKNVKVINTTKQGAHIEGTIYLPLEKVLNEYLKEQNVKVEHWFEAQSSYKVEMAQGKFNKLQGSFDDMWINLQQSLQQLETIQNLYKKNIYSNFNNQLTKFDKVFNKVQESVFFKIIIRPITRIQNENFIKRSPEVKMMRNPMKKAELFIEIFGSYVKTVLATVIYVQPAFKEMKKVETFKEKR